MRTTGRHLTEKDKRRTGRRNVYLIHRGKDESLTWYGVLALKFLFIVVTDSVCIEQFSHGDVIFLTKQFPPERIFIYTSVPDSNCSKVTPSNKYCFIVFLSRRRRLMKGRRGCK